MKWFDDASLKTKFSFIFGGIIIGAFIAIAFGQWAFARVQVGGRYFSGIELKRDAVDELARIRMNLNMVRVLYYDYVVDDEDTVESVRKMLGSTRDIFRTLESKGSPASDGKSLYCGSCHAPETYETIFASVKAGREAWERFEEKIKGNLSGGGSRQELLAGVGEVSEIYLEIMEATKMPVDVLRSVSPLQVEKLKKESQYMRYSFLVGGVIGSVLLMFIAIFLSKIIVSPVLAVAESSAAMAEGDFSAVEVNVTGHDELGRMAGSFRDMSERLTRFAGETKEGIFNLSSSAEELSATTDVLARTTESQHSQADQVVTATEEMSQTIQDVAQNALKAAETNKHSAQLAESGRAVANDAVAAIEKISHVVMDATGTIEALGSRTDEIGEIVSVITDIADQTNLLALNAAIEAARAGDHGRGFAVVADEVRKLAEKTARSTREISARITQIQNEARRSVDVMRGSREVVARGVDMVSRMTDTLNSIAEASANAAQIVDRIAVATEEQSSTAENISQNMGGLFDGIKDTLNASNQIKTVSLELASLSEKLKLQAAWFKT
ncbi:MAG: methyl-accepting chemotaxis protein [Nitrospirae bacterium]|nr:methyl-accepting chemotaxis protein [Nitrospirota bacterium]